MALNLGFWIYEGFRGIFYHRLTAAVSIMGIGLSLWIFGFLYVAWENLNQYRENLLSGLQIEVFLDTEIGPASHQKIGEQIMVLDGINNIEYISTDKAAEIFAEDFGDELFEILEDNPLPASFKVRIEPEYLNTDSTRKLIDRISTLRGAEEAVFHGDLLQKIRYRFKNISLSLAVAASLILIAAVIVFFQGIGLSIRARKDFVNSLVLSGAKIETIRIPFIWEGILIGFIAGTLACAALIIIVFLTDKFLISMHLPDKLLLIIPAGTIAGYAGALVSARNHLRGFLNLHNISNN
ncbi:MAG: hypothetical protein H8E46_10030 [FCB group bacterium]|nr:hypothetical protein [FCB group bacterium]